MSIIRILAVGIVIVALLHTLATFFIFTSNNAGSGITGRVTLQPDLSRLTQTHILVLAVEWLAVIVVILILLIKSKMGVARDIKESGEVAVGVQFKKQRHETDLDLLYKLLKEKKEMKLAVVAGVFGISKGTAMEWCKVLEAGNLAEIRYPTVGDPKVLLAKKGKKGENEDEDYY